MKVCVIGLGYVGFPTACVVARAGHEVLGVDVNRDVIHKLNDGGLHIVNEDGLFELARDAFSSGRLRVSDHPEGADVFIIAVPTPYRRFPEKAIVPMTNRESPAALGRPCDSDQTSESRVACPEVAVTKEEALTFRADLSYVEHAAREIVPHIRPGNLVVLESTVPPGTTDSLVRSILERGTGLMCGRDIYLAHAPERVLPGRILEELTANDRIIGGINGESVERAVSFYRTFVHGELLGTDTVTAEFVKLMENTFRDVNIALANEFALICEELGISVFEAIALANRHPRVQILKPGPGVGGHCVAVDPYFIVEAVPDRARLISLARQVNSSMPYHVLELVRQIAKMADQAGTAIERIAALGASYKPDVGDERESPALEVVRLIAADGYDVSVHDPYIERFRQETLADLLAGSDLLLMLTDHRVYQDELRPNEVLRQMRQPLILDTRGFFGPEWDAAGFHVVRLGVGQRCGWKRRTSNRATC